MKNKTEQLSLFDKAPKVDRYAKRRKWAKALQTWSDKMAQIGTTPQGKCGYMAICDNCADNYYGRPCYRAYMDYCRDHKIKVDFDDYNFDDNELL